MANFTKFSDAKRNRSAAFSSPLRRCVPTATRTTGEGVRVATLLAVAIFSGASIFISGSGFGEQPNPSERSLQNPPVSSSISSADPEPIQYVLTRLGIVHEGVVRDRGETVFLQISENGGGLTISKLDMVMIAPSRRELFEFQRRQLPPGDVGAMLRLAEWGGRNQLGAEGIAFLRESIEQIATPVEKGVLAEKLRQMETVERIKVEAKFRTHATAPRPVTESGATPEIARLEKLEKDFPPTLLDRFTRRVQPVLRRRCASVECHAAGVDSDFILHPPQPTEKSRSTTLRNLESVLDRVDFVASEKSPILNHPPINDSLGGRLYPFGEDSRSMADYELFAEWVGSLRGRVKNYTPDPARWGDRSTARSASPPPLSAMPDSEDWPEDYGPGTVFGLDDDAMQHWRTGNDFAPEIPVGNAPDGLVSNISVGEMVNNGGRGPVQLTTPEGVLQHVEPQKNILKDEFDPLPFNRKYHPNRISLP